MPIGTLEAIQQGGLVLYACLKAFLPLPSLEVVLIPLILKNPDGWLLYAMEGLSARQSAAGSAIRSQGGPSRPCCANLPASRRSHQAGS